MTITYKGGPGVVKIGNRWLEPGDKVGDAAKSRSVIACDTKSLERLACRGDFEASKKKPEEKKVTTDG